MPKPLTDAWLNAALVLREVARDHPAVVGLDQSSRYETRGTGRPIRGIALQAMATEARAHIGLVLDERQVWERGIPVLVNEIGVRLSLCWTMLPMQQTLTLCLDVVNLTASAGPRFQTRTPAGSTNTPGPDPEHP